MIYTLWTEAQAPYLAGGHLSTDAPEYGEVIIEQYDETIPETGEVSRYNTWLCCEKSLPKGIRLAAKAVTPQAWSNLLKGTFDPRNCRCELQFHGFTLILEG